MVAAFGALNDPLAVIAQGVEVGQVVPVVEVHPVGNAGAVTPSNVSKQTCPEALLISMIDNKNTVRKEKYIFLISNV